ncbi:hypothetical protein, partial [Pseudomonas sp.]|uniref:hypothetical protein n=1 Tax=Pseudomonas sp. TaxID=306 RepID=UPI003CC679F9
TPLRKAFTPALDECHTAAFTGLSWFEVSSHHSTCSLALPICPPPRHQFRASRVENAHMQRLPIPPPLIIRTNGWGLA